MMTRVNKIFIGKDISRTAALIDGAAFTVVAANVAEGEIVVLDKNYEVLAATAVVADTDTIYIAEGTSETNAVVNEAGTSTTYRKLIVSDPIVAGKIKAYNRSAYVAKTEEAFTIPAISGTIVAGTEYVLRIVYRDIIEHPGQFTATYRYIAKTGDDSTAVFNGLRARIAKHTGRLGIKGGARITASGTTTLVLTAKAIPECTTSVNDIDELSMVNMEVYFNYVDSTYQWAQVPTASAITNTLANRGNGTWEVIRDIEKKAQSYKGIMNRTWFPIVKPEMRTVKGATYQTITIEHDQDYRSPDMQYVKSAPVTTMIAFAVGAGTQDTTNITALESWVASTGVAVA